MVVILLLTAPSFKPAEIWRYVRYRVLLLSLELNHC